MSVGKLLHFPQVRRIMTDERWSKEVARLKNRLTRIALAQAGTADVRRVPVEGGWVRRHRRAKHTRIVISLRTGKIKGEK